MWLALTTGKGEKVSMQVYQAWILGASSKQVNNNFLKKDSLTSIQGRVPFCHDLDNILIIRLKLLFKAPKFILCLTYISCHIE